VKKDGLGRKIGAMAALGLATSFVGTPDAKAHRRHFPFTYDWFQPSKGEKEIELKTRYRGRNNSLRQEVEFEYGISDRLVIAPYLEFEKDAGGDLKYSAWKLETRYQLGEYKDKAILPGLYFEVKDEKDGPFELEGKLILSRYGKDGSDLSFNYIVERELENGAEFENLYSIAYGRPLGKSKRNFFGGVEWIHNLSSGRINAGPTLGFAPTGNTWIVAGYAFPVNNRGGNEGEFRLIAEYEWF